jgi:opacity protein-like surface antigen
MNKLFLLLSTVAFVNVSFAAEADNDKPYLEVGYTRLTYKEGSYSSMPSNMRLVAGKNDGNLGYEGLYSFKVSSDGLTIGSVSADYKVNHIIGLYGKALMNLTDKVELFGRLGWARIDVTTSVSSVTKSDSGGGLSYGLGAKYAFEKNINLNIDYMVYYPTRNNITLDGFTFGLGFSF